MLLRKNYDLPEKRSASEMHFDTKNWLSELNFVKDELQFLQGLIEDYTARKELSKKYPELQLLFKKLYDLIQKFNPILVNVKKHNNDLDYLLDRIDQPFEEHEVKAEHVDLVKITEDFFHDFKELKMNVFILISSIMKEEKAK